MLIRIRNVFIAGIAVIFPIFVTFILVRFLFMEINHWILNPFTKFLSPYLNSVQATYTAKIGIFVLTFMMICIIGWAANVIVLRKFFRIGENLLFKIPMVGKIYSAVRQISTAFLGQGKTIFKKVVLVEYPRKGVYSIGLVTGDGRGEIKNITNEDLINVFIPTTPIPTSGIFIMVPRRELRFLKMTVEEGMKLVISGGAVVPPYL